MSATHNNERPQHQIVLGHKGDQNPQGTSLLANLSSNDEIIQVCYVFFLTGIDRKWPNIRTPLKYPQI